MKKQSPYVLANEFKVRKAQSETFDLNSRYEVNVIKTDFLEKYKISSLMKIYSYGVRPKKMRKGRLIRNVI